MMSYLLKGEFPIDLNLKDDLGNTPLMLLIKLSKRNTNYVEMTRRLLQKGADPKIKDSDGWSCMEEAISQVIPYQVAFNSFKGGL